MCTHVYKIIVRIYMYNVFIDIDMFNFYTYMFVHVSGVVETCSYQTKCIGKYATNGYTWNVWEFVHRFVKSLAKFTATKKLVL